MATDDAPRPREDSEGARPTVAASGVGGALSLVIAAAALYFARDIFVPLAIAGLSYLGDASPARLRLLARRLRRRAPDGTSIILGLWSARAFWEGQHEAPVEEVATSLADALDRIAKLTSDGDHPSLTPPSAIAVEPAAPQ